jgi:hypothetical protein
MLSSVILTFPTLLLSLNHRFSLNIYGTIQQYLSNSFIQNFESIDVFIIKLILNCNKIINIFFEMLQNY